MMVGNIEGVADVELDSVMIDNKTEFCREFYDFYEIVVGFSCNCSSYEI